MCAGRGGGRRRGDRRVLAIRCSGRGDRIGRLRICALNAHVGSK